MIKPISKYQNNKLNRLEVVDYAAKNPHATQAEIARHFNCAQTSISRILMNEGYAYIKKTRKKLDIPEVIAYTAKNPHATQAMIARHFNCTQNSISRILRSEGYAYNKKNCVKATWDNPIILDKGTINEFDYAIIHFGSHPEAFVRIPQSHPLYKFLKGKDLLDDIYAHDIGIDIDCHGGIAYSADKIAIVPAQDGYWWIGWTYSYDGDYAEFPVPEGIQEGKKWTTEEIRAEVEDVIDQLKTKW